MDTPFHSGFNYDAMVQQQEEVGVPNEILRVAHKLVPVNEAPGRAILVTSVAAEEGKSLILRHLAQACGAVLDQRVLVSDLHTREKDFSIPSGADYPNITGSMVGAPQHMASMSGEFSQELQATFSIEPTMRPHIKRLELNMGHGNIYRFLTNQLPFYRQEYRLVLVEAPGILSNQKPDTVVLSPLFDQVILVIQPQKTVAEKIQEAVNLLRNNGVNNLQLLLNRGPGNTQDEALTAQLMRSPWVNKVLAIPVVRKLGTWLQGRSRKSKKKAQPNVPSMSPSEMGYSIAPPPNQRGAGDRTYPSMAFDLDAPKDGNH